MTKTTWTQPAPTKAYAVWMNGAWYGEGDTPAGAWQAVRNQVSAGHCREGNAMFAKIRRFGKVEMSAAERERRQVMAYVEEGLGGETTEMWFG